MNFPGKMEMSFRESDKGKKRFVFTEGYVTRVLNGVCEKYL